MAFSTLYYFLSHVFSFNSLGFLVFCLGYTFLVYSIIFLIFYFVSTRINLSSLYRPSGDDFSLLVLPSQFSGHGIIDERKVIIFPVYFLWFHTSFLTFYIWWSRPGTHYIFFIHRFLLLCTVYFGRYTVLVYMLEYIISVVISVFFLFTGFSEFSRSRVFYFASIYHSAVIIVSRFHYSFN